MPLLTVLCPWVYEDSSLDITTTGRVKISRVTRYCNTQLLARLNDYHAHSQCLSNESVGGPFLTSLGLLFVRYRANLNLDHRN